MNDIFRYEARIKIIGKRIREERKAAHLTQEQLASEISRRIDDGPNCKEGIKQNAISNWEQGLTLPPINKIACLAQIFDCDVGYLLGDYDQRKREIADVCEVTGFSEEAIQRIVDIKKMGGNAGLDIVSKLMTDEDFWNAIAYINYARYAVQNSDRPMSEALQECVLYLEMTNGIERHPGATIPNPKQIKDLNVFHASRKFSDCISHILCACDM